MEFNLEQLNDLLYCTRTVLKQFKNESISDESISRINALVETIYSEIERQVHQQPEH